jgi:hypothetical protein
MLGLLLAVMVAVAAPAAAQETLDVSKLPIDLERIQKVLKEGTVREERDGLNLRYTVEVFGQAPPLELFTPGESLTTGPVPDSAPTHRDMIEHVTPREYRSPPADLGALFRWLAERSKK